MGDRLVIDRSRHADALGPGVDLVRFAMRGPRGGLRAEQIVNRREAERQYDRLGAILGQQPAFATPRAIREDGA